MNLKCLQCEHEFEGTIEKDALGWHSSCPKCGGSFDVDVPRGRIFVAFTNPIYGDEKPYASFTVRPEKNIHACYAFETPEEFLVWWHKMVEDPGAMWYWVLDEDYVITYGACSPDDIELFLSAWDMGEEEKE